MNIDLTNVHRPEREEDYVKVNKSNDGSFHYFSNLGGRMSDLHTDRASLERLRDGLNELLDKPKD